MNFFRFALIGVTICLALTTGCKSRDDDYLVGTLERDRIVLTAERSEPVVTMHVREGDRLAAGDPILQLDPARALAERDRLQAGLDQARRRVDELVRGPRKESIREARARLAASEARSENASQELRRFEQLASENLASTSQLDNARTAHTRAAAERDAMRAALDTLLDGTTVEELDQARAQVDAAAAAVRMQDILVGRLAITAPRAGRIEVLPYKMGSQPPQGADVAILLAHGAPHARVHVPVSMRDRFAEGANVPVRVPGFGEFTGRVRWVSSDAAFTPYYALTQHDRGHLSHAAEIDLEGDEANELPTGIPVEVVAQ